MPATPQSNQDRGGRCQVRISLSERDGRLWEWLQLQPEKTRAREVLHLMRLGLAVVESMSGRACMPGGAAMSAQAEPRADGGVPTEAHTPAGLRGLADFNVDAFNF